MAKHFLSLTFALALGATALGLSASAQATKPADIYPSNLEENMYFEKYDGASNTVKGLYFMVLSDGNNSKDRTPEFTVKLYLYQEGQDPIFIKTFEEEGIYHMGSKEYKLNVPIPSDVPKGTYRLGVYVNADKSFTENDANNATFFKGEIVIGKSSSNDVKQPGVGTWQKEDGKKGSESEEEQDSGDHESEEDK